MLTYKFVCILSHNSSHSISYFLIFTDVIEIFQLIKDWPIQVSVDIDTCQSSCRFWWVSSIEGNNTTLDLIKEKNKYLISQYNKNTINRGE